MALGVRESAAGEPVLLADKRSYLFLQGPIGPFFPELARAMRGRGHRVHRIHFNGGDQLIWRLSGAVSFREPAPAWPAFLSARLDEWQVSDVVLFGDCRPLHREAIRQARSRGIAVHVFEEGYLRPNWITMELGGVNRHSSLPKSPLWYRDAVSGLPDWDEGLVVPRSFFSRAIWDISHNLGMLLLAWRYPHFRTHRPWPAAADYKAGAKRFVARPLSRRRSARLADQIRKWQRPYFLFPLQLEADSQIRFHSSFGSMAPAIEQVITSFARHASTETMLVVSEHPLDTGVVDLREVTRRAAQRAGLSERVVYLECGTPMDLLEHARGLVTVNSTVGIQALGLGLPVKVLGEAIYDMPQLSDQQELDGFWCQARAPDPETFAAFRHIVGLTTQINGSFFCRAGRRLAVAAAAERLAARYLPAPYGPQLKLAPLVTAVDELASLGASDRQGILRTGT